MSETAPVGGQTMNDRVTEEIRVLLARRRLRDHALAPVLGVSQQSVSMRLRGRKPWTVDELDAVASFFAVQDANTLLPGLGKQGVDEVCAPWDLNPEPADSVSAQVSGRIAAAAHTRSDIFAQRSPRLPHPRAPRALTFPVQQVAGRHPRPQAA